jgi:hypothetical protein
LPSPQYRCSMAAPPLAVNFHLIIAHPPHRLQIPAVDKGMSVMLN